MSQTTSPADLVPRSDVSSARAVVFRASWGNTWGLVCIAGMAAAAPFFIGWGLGPPYWPYAASYLCAGPIAWLTGQTGLRRRKVQLRLDDSAFEYLDEHGRRHVGQYASIATIGLRTVNHQPQDVTLNMRGGVSIKVIGLSPADTRTVYRLLGGGLDQ